MEFKIDTDMLLKRFLEYVAVETTSDEGSKSSPSSACQWDLLNLLYHQLQEMGLEVSLSKTGYIYASLPERLPPDSPKKGKIPALGFLAHVDVSPAVSGKGVKPLIHSNYQGDEIKLPKGPNVVLSPQKDAPLGECLGLDIITSDGSTLLGADDKAGIAIIFSMLEVLLNSEIPHGPIKIAFTPDEEIGRGVDHFDLEAFGAEVAYTVDGESLGEIEDETFCADAMWLRFQGINIHPGYAKGKLINAIKLAAEFLDALPKDRLSPETTAGREGFVHPINITGNEEQAEIRFIIRDFEEEGLKEKERLLSTLAQEVAARYPGARAKAEVREQYRNMKGMIDRRPECAAFAVEAIKAAGLEVLRNPIRGGTDGARLSFMGLPTPNLFTGGHNFHGRREWIALQHMEKSVEVCLNLTQIWMERGERKGLLKQP